MIRGKGGGHIAAHICQNSENQTLKRINFTGYKFYYFKKYLIDLFVAVLGLGKGNGTPLQYFCLENPMDGGAWQAAVHRVSKSQT